MSRPQIARDDPSINPNSLHQFHAAIRGPKGVPEVVLSVDTAESVAKHPGHPYARTKFVSFEFYDQRRSNAQFGYEHFVSLPPSYHEDSSREWPLIMFLHGSGESQRSPNESFSSIRHGIAKIILCYDKLRAGYHGTHSAIDIPVPQQKCKNNHSKHGDKSAEPVSSETCTILAENFVTVTPALNMSYGYGWSSPILSALLHEIMQRYRIDADQVHLTGFSMGGYGVWNLALREPERFATLTPICGGGDPSQVHSLKKVPIWIHHGAKDDIIPVQASQTMYDALLASGSQLVNFTCDPELMHDCWSEAYNTAELYRWMLDHRRTGHSQ